MSTPRHRTSVVIEADGGSRGNPGQAAYGAVLKDAATGEVIAEEGTTIGVASNNVAEYSGLIAGLKLAAELAPDADIDAELAKLAAERGPIVEGMPADLLALYDRLRAAKGGVGAAALRARQCSGCMLSLDNAELAVIRSASTDEVLRCEECQRILVRTSESGL